MSALPALAEAPTVPTSQLPTSPPRGPRRIPAPLTEPPYDDELAAPVPRAPRAVEGTLALAFDLPSGVPATPAPPAAPAPSHLRLVTAGSAATPQAGAAWHDDEDADPARRRTARAQLPDPRVWAGRLVQATIEVLGGLRPAAQLVRWTTAEVYDEVAACVGTARAGTGRAAVRSVRVCEPADGIAEVSAVIQRGPRAQAVALRLEGVDGRWKCTTLAFC